MCDPIVGAGVRQSKREPDGASWQSEREPDAGF
jgi:hypothetical protein